MERFLGQTLDIVIYVLIMILCDCLYKILKICDTLLLISLGFNLITYTILGIIVFFFIPFPSSRLMKMLVIPVCTYISCIWANPNWYRGNNLWCKMLSTSRGTVYIHNLAKMKALGNFIPSDIETILSQPKFVPKNSTANDSCATAVRNSDSRMNNIINASHRNFLRVRALEQGAQYTKQERWVFRKKVLWQTY